MSFRCSATARRAVVRDFSGIGTPTGYPSSRQSIGPVRCAQHFGFHSAPSSFTHNASLETRQVSRWPISRSRWTASRNSRREKLRRGLQGLWEARLRGLPAPAVRPPCPNQVSADLWQAPQVAGEFLGPWNRMWSEKGVVGPGSWVHYLRVSDHAASAHAVGARPT